MLVLMWTSWYGRGAPPKRPAEYVVERLPSSQKHLPSSVHCSTYSSQCPRSRTPSCGHNPHDNCRCGQGSIPTLNGDVFRSLNISQRNHNAACRGPGEQVNRRHVRGTDSLLELDWSWTYLDYGRLSRNDMHKQQAGSGSGRNRCLAKQPKGSGCIARRGPATAHGSRDHHDAALDWYLHGAKLHRRCCNPTSPHCRRPTSPFPPGRRRVAQRA